MGVRFGGPASVKAFLLLMLRKQASLALKIGEVRGGHVQGLSIFTFPHKIEAMTELVGMRRQIK